MGVTLESKHFSADMGYGGFGRFREKVAFLTNPEFGNHYAKLSDPKIMFIMGEERKTYFKKYDAETNNMVEQKIVSEEVANFCYQADCEGTIDQNQAKRIYEKIKDYDDKVCYGYSGRSDCAMFSDLKAIFKDCAENGGEIDWC